MLYNEEKFLAPYAMFSSKSKGRKYFEKQHEYRNEFQRDRERIIHSKAFRRLEYKTQVFINHEGDHYRTRLTHTIEVAQIARTIARAMHLNEDLSEAIALAHDLGHTPFGHAGERELNDLLKDHGGFEHNRQSLKVVEKLEKKYADFPGLNLTWETREGIIKHSKIDKDSPDIADFNPMEQPTLEAQIIDIADEIAYNNHDLDDGVSSGILKIEDVKNLKIWNLAHAGISHNLPENQKMAFNEMIRRIINLLATDLISNTLKNIKSHNITDSLSVKKLENPIVLFSPNIIIASLELKQFLRKELYEHYKVARMTIKAKKVINDLFTIYTEHPDTLIDTYQEKVSAEGIYMTATDYIAGMTDRFALEEHKKLTDPLIGV